MRTIPVALAAAVVLLPVFAPLASEPPLKQEPACLSKSDGCQVCRLADGKVVACSLPGIACVKGEWHCNEPAAVPPLPDAVPAPTPGAPAPTPAPSKDPDPVPAP